MSEDQLYFIGEELCPEDTASEYNTLLTEQDVNYEIQVNLNQPQIEYANIGVQNYLDATSGVFNQDTESSFEIIHENCSEFEQLCIDSDIGGHGSSEDASTKHGVGDIESNMQCDDNHEQERGNADVSDSNTPALPPSDEHQAVLSEHYVGSDISSDDTIAEQDGEENRNSPAVLTDCEETPQDRSSGPAQPTTGVGEDSKELTLLNGNLKSNSCPQIKKHIATHNSIALSWDELEDQVDHYKIKYVSLEAPGHDLTVQTESCETHCTIANLIPATEYEFNIQSVSDNGICSDGAVYMAMTRPTSPPTKPEICQTSTTAFSVKWSRPKFTGISLPTIIYIARIHPEHDIEEIQISDVKKDGSQLMAEIPFTPNSEFSVQIYAKCDGLGSSLYSPHSNKCYMYASSEEMCKAKLREGSNLLTKGTPSIYQLKLRQVYLDKWKRIEKCELGRKGKSNPEEKVVIVVGATGSGKTTLINGMMNYIAGIDWEDPFRFKLIVEDDAQHGNQAVSQTSWISSYTIHHREGFRVPYTVTIIDSPGFGDTSGVMRDKEITEQIRTFFTTVGHGGIDHIDAVGFVIQSSLPRLTPTQRYIFDQILSLFGKDIGANVFLLLTFADGQRPQVLSGLQEAKMSYENYFKFNNSALFVENQASSDKSSDECNFDEMFWKMGQKSFEVFYQCLHTIESKSLLLTKDVLNERSQLEIFVVNIQQEIQVGLNKLEILKQEIELLKRHQAAIDANKDFNYIVTEDKVVTIPIPQNHYVTNCIPCKRTCHERCAIKDDENKINCSSMDRTGHCKMCPNGCIWNLHKNFPYIFTIKQERVTKTSEDLRQRYQEAGQKKLTAESLIEKVVDEFEAVQIKVVGMADEIRKSIERLQEIALKPNPLTTLDYLDILIDSERQEAQPGWNDRLKQLREIRQQVVYMKKVAEKGFDPFAKYREKINEEKKTKKGGIWETAGRYLGKLKFWR